MKWTKKRKQIFKITAKIAQFLQELIQIKK